MDAGTVLTVAGVCYTIYQTWDDMHALKRELKPFRDLARAIEDVTKEGKHGGPRDKLGEPHSQCADVGWFPQCNPNRLTQTVPAGPVVDALKEASAFLLEHKNASTVRRFIQGPELRARARQILVTLSQGLQAVQMHVRLDMARSCVLLCCRL